MAKASPQRSCLGCRAVKPKEELLRFVLDPAGSPVPDVAAKLPGRGAYTCYCRQCLETAVAKKQFGRAYKGEAKPPVLTELLAILERVWQERIMATVALANKAGKAVSGSDRVLESLRRGDVELLLLAEDISPDSAAKFRAAARGQVEIFSFALKERLGAPLGQELRTAVAVTAGSFAGALRRDLTHYRNFFQGGAIKDEQD